MTDKLDEARRLLESYGYVISRPEAQAPELSADDVVRRRYERSIKARYVDYK